jgi:hypothetical protein
MIEPGTGPQVVSPRLAGLLQMIYGAQTAQVIYVAAKLGIADLLADDAKDLLEISATTGVDAGVLRRIFGMLVSRGLLARQTDGRFSLTESGSLLRSDRADSVRERAIFNAEILYPLWGELLHSVTSGQSAAVRVFGKPLYEHLAEHPEARTLFDRTMASAARYRHGPAVAAYDFSRFGSIVDVGGGNGALLISILKSCPEARGVVFDLAPASLRARQNIQAAGLGDRCTFVAGNAFERVPAGGDAYVLSNFLIDMDDGRACTVLGNCRAVMSDTGTLLLVEWMSASAPEADDEYRSWDTASMDLIMLAVGGSSGGRVRTEDEFRAILNASGFMLRRIVSTGAAVRVIEAMPA